MKQTYRHLLVFPSAELIVQGDRMKGELKKTKFKQTLTDKNRKAIEFACSKKKKTSNLLYSDEWKYKKDQLTGGCK